MKEWIKISLVLCSFGFFREMRPSEPFVTTFLSDERWRNVTSEQINREIYPIGTYSYLAQLCIVFLVTDVLRCACRFKSLDSSRLTITRTFQVQTYHHSVGSCRHSSLVFAAMDVNDSSSLFRSTVLWIFHGSRNCLLHLHVCQS